MTTLQRIPLNTLAIAFGLCGLAATWSIASDVLPVPVGIADALWIVAAVSWLWLIVAHTLRGARSTDSLASQLRHPVQGPIAALIPIVGMLLGGELYTVWAIGGVILFLASLLATAAFVTWLLPFWMRGGFTLESVHGGYLLPTVAGGFVASLTAAEVGFHDLALAAFGIGAFFWVIMFGIVFNRMMFRPPLPDPLVPTLAILAAPGALAGRAWFDIAGRNANDVQLAIAGLAVVGVLFQVGLIPLYRSLTFSLGFWSFTFPLAALGRYGIAWLDVENPPGCHIWEIVILVVVTAVILAVSVQSIRLFLRGRRAGRALGEQQLNRADNPK